MKNKVFFTVSIIFIFIGLAFFFSNKFMMKQFSKTVENSKETYATITSVGEDVYFTFEDDSGKSYTVRSNYQSSSMRIGDKIKINYNIKNPKIAKVNIEEFDEIFNYVFYGMSAFMIFIGVLILILGMLQYRNKNKLLQNGLMLSASITSVEYNNLYNINGRHPYIIRANFIYNGITYEAKSENIWTNPQYIIDNYNIKELPVYINPEKPKTNILDISEIKNKLGK